MKLKQCTKCLIKKPVSKFHKIKHGRFGVSSWCADCKNNHQSMHSNKVLMTGTRVCRTCAIEQDIQSFDINRSQVTGRRRTCKECKKWKRKEFQYGITRDEWMGLLESQNHCCAICKCDKPNDIDWSTDHDHETGEVRGLLCRTCNLMIGYAYDNITVLQSAITYLENDS